jgi:hypothetical protein
MPTRPVRRKGKIVGYKWGKHGKIYKTKKQANKQGAAIHASGYNKK